MDDFRIGDYLVQPSLNRITRGEAVTHVRPQVMDVLVSIVRGAGRPVSKEQILEEVWPGLYVVDSAVSRCVGEVRALLGDDLKSPTYIQNIPKRGYRLLRTVEPAPRAGFQADVTREGPAVGGSGVDFRVGSFEGLPNPVECSSDVAATGEPDVSAPTPSGEVPPAPGSVPAAESGAFQTPEPVRLEPAGDIDAAAPAMATRRRSFSRWLGLAAATGAAVLAGVLLGPWKPAPALGVRDTVVIADFTNRTGDPVFDEGLRIALAVQLEQSPYLQVVSPSQVRDALRFMNVDPSSPLTPTLARDVARREGITAVVEGSIVRFGKRYAVGLEATGALSGEVLARELVEAESRAAVLDALSLAVRRLRPRLGESLATVERFDTPVVRATTSSFESLRAYGQAERLREQSSTDTDERAALLYEHAIELDPGFAIAYAKLARVVRMRGDAARATTLATRAYELRERASEAERFYILAHYYEDAINDRAKAYENYETWKRTYPRAWVPWYVLGNTYLMRGEFSKAVEHAERAVGLVPNDVRLLVALAGAYNVTGRYAETRRVLDRARQRNAGDLGILLELFDVAAATSDRALLATLVAEWPADAPSQSRRGRKKGGRGAPGAPPPRAGA
jgi:DNA-binding winged helix-turn-helix (wHTH) protein/tetratricopeptide (TPR) repeat protein